MHQTPPTMAEPQEFHDLSFYPRRFVRPGARGRFGRSDGVPTSAHCVLCCVVRMFGVKGVSLLFPHRSFKTGGPVLFISRQAHARGILWWAATPSSQTFRY
jgi:hypothetical protein